MKFYIVTGSIRLTEEDRGLAAKWFPGFFNLLYASTEFPMKEREITPQIIKEHLSSSRSWARLRFDSIEEAMTFARETYCREDEAVPIYSCHIPSEPRGTTIVGKPSQLPSNAVFFSIDEFVVDGAALLKKDNSISYFDLLSTGSTTYRP